MFSSAGYLLKYLSLDRDRKNPDKVWMLGYKSLSLHSQKINVASLAQLVEQLTLNQWVQGSNP